MLKLLFKNSQNIFRNAQNILRKAQITFDVIVKLFCKLLKILHYTPKNRFLSKNYQIKILHYMAKIFDKCQKRDGFIIIMIY